MIRRVLNSSASSALSVDPETEVLFFEAATGEIGWTLSCSGIKFKSGIPEMSKLHILKGAGQVSRPDLRYPTKLLHLCLDTPYTLPYN